MQPQTFGNLPSSPRVTSDGAMSGAAFDVATDDHPNQREKRCGAAMM